MKIQLPAEILQAFFGEEQHLVELKSSATHCGVAGSRVLFFTNGNGNENRGYALKYGRTAIPLSQQIKNRELLARYIPHRLPRVLSYCTYNGGEAMLMENIDGPNLHEAVALGVLTDDSTISVIESILSEFQDMWERSKSPLETLTRDPRTRAAKRREATETLLLTYGIAPTDKLIVNGQCVGTLEEIGAQLERYRYPEFSVVCHSDLNADNFFLDREGRWYIGDWEWAGQHDWQLSLSHLYGWWTGHLTRLTSTPRIKKIGDQVEFQYELHSPEICGRIQEKCLEAGITTAHRLGDQRGLQNQFWLLVGTFLLGEVRWMQRRNRTGYEIPMIGEGLRILSELLRVA